MERHLKALLVALVLLALYAVPVAAQDGDRDCMDFNSQAEAQQYFEENGGSATNNVDDLDRNNNGVACENNIGDYPDPATDLTPAEEVQPTPAPTLEPTEQGTPEVGPTVATEIRPEATKEMPDGMGNTGAGGFATGASVPWGSLGLAASGLLAAGYAVLRRR